MSIIIIIIMRLRCIENNILPTYQLVSTTKNRKSRKPMKYLIYICLIVLTFNFKFKIILYQMRYRYTYYKVHISTVVTSNRLQL